MRTAQSVPSATTRRPVAKRVPLTYRSIGSSAWRSSSTTAPGGSPTICGGRHLRAAELGPHAHGDARRATGAPRHGRGAAPRGGRRPASGDLGAAARRARASCARRRRSGRAGRAGTARRRPRRAARRRAGCARRRRSPRRRARERAASPARRSRPRCRAPRGRAGGRGHHLVHRLGDGGELELGELGRRPGPRRRSMPIIAAASLRRARRASSRTRCRR